MSSSWSGGEARSDRRHDELTERTASVDNAGCHFRVFGWQHACGGRHQHGVPAMPAPPAASTPMAVTQARPVLVIIRGQDGAKRDETDTDQQHATGTDAVREMRRRRAA